MGTRGFKAWRFRKRYYFQYNHWDSYPEGLGQMIVATIPSKPEEYQTWLKDQRKAAAAWEAEWNDYLTMDPNSKVKEIATEMMAENHPTWFAPLNDLFIEWVYILDLDREIFSVNNGAHFKLEQAPHIDWINALADGCHGDKVQLLPKENVPDLLAGTPVANEDASREASGEENSAIDKQDEVGCRVVTPKNIVDIPWRRRHGPVLRSCLFWLWSRTLEDKLAATLLQWSPEDPPFREMAFAILCLASGEKNVTIVPTRCLKGDRTYAKLDTEIISSLTTGAHIPGVDAGSSPKGVIYWLDGVLVVLTSQLYRANAVELEVFRVAQYCRENHPNDCVDAVLVSIEHVVLVHIIPGKEVQRSNIMPLVPIEHHISMDARSRYSGSYLDKLVPADGDADEEFKEKQKKKLRKAARERMAKNEGIVMHYGDTDDEEEEDDEDPALHITTRGVEGDPSSTFYALTHLFDAAARRRMPPVKPIEGRLPNEIYARILSYVIDPETKLRCMEVSRVFRQLCQEDVLIADGLIFEPCEAVEACVEADHLPNWYDIYDLATDEHYQASLQKEGALSDFSRTPSRMVLIGTERNRRSYLPNLTFKFEKTD